ncbi:MAG: tRNA pseudouridine(55) synthase TruB [Cyanobium sp. MAG_102]|jgi:tRNA pseudouridine55 synthase|uniref:tRNA pseudouridine(55) synthase TruB n=1 Tax=Cyanobium usitatum TaxID=2304190 RepID=UPI00275E4897|nr:tRNA pseudouridine(55) synthase TruB [Cyanobium usitatum]MDP4737387.1 tRNA pseudouridine(55) synthase TruB [Cyanobium sp. MAG_216]MDP4948432.1 tRNA pseudouridine(55) synthase TruB [Cyanobium sp. MAG_102]CAK6688356.1 tRNA pseudouridine synthase B [Cyanobium usitatum str. Tous]
MADQPCGFLVLDKAAGLTSHACVARVRRAYKLKRVGHGGTLDPAVTGVLPIALGPATRLLPYLEGDKTYRGVVQLGLRTVSDDLEGEVLASFAVPALEAADLEAALASFRGPIQQVPPQVSAVHVKGQRAYALVRQGEQLELAPRAVTIQRLELLGWDGATARLELLVRCSAGTYIRSLARDLGEALGCGGALAQLRRSEALGFGLEQAVPLEALDQAPLPPLLNPLAALGHLPQRQLLDAELEGWRCGRALDHGLSLEAGEPVAVLGPDGNLAGMARTSEGGLLQPKLVFNATG